MVAETFFYYSYWGETESHGTAATTGLLYQPRMIGDGDCGEIGGILIPFYLYAPESRSISISAFHKECRKGLNLENISESFFFLFYI
jgi:hypothetical protein